jgi:hypothetical protein
VAFCSLLLVNGSSTYHIDLWEEAEINRTELMPPAITAIVWGFYSFT